MKTQLKIAALALFAAFGQQPSRFRRLALRAAIMLLSLGFGGQAAAGFEGRIQVTLTRGGESQSLVYTVGAHRLRIERGELDRPHAKNILHIDTGELTLLFPNNRSFVRLKSTTSTNAAAPTSGVLALPAMPPGVGPQTSMPSAPPAPAHIGQTSLPGMPAMPPMPVPPVGFPPGVGQQAGALPMPQMPAMPMAVGMPAMPMMPPTMENIELVATGDKTNLLGYACRKFEIRQHGEVMEVWATDQLFPFQPYLQNQPHRFGPRGIEERWGDLLKDEKLFPLRAVLRFEPATGPGQPPPAPGPERMRFEVISVTPEKIEDKDGSLFQPPADYREMEPLPF